MASIYQPVFRAKNANGVIVSGAGLWVYETGTTTPASIFTDEGLTTPASNPLTSDSAGYFAQFFIASATRVDLQCRADATDNTSTLLWQALKIDSLGADDASTFLRDFGDDGRLQARGASGTVNLEFGDPSGDDVGGTGRIGGWSGTQADEIELDAASVPITGDLAVAGDVTVTGDGPFEKIIGNATKAAAATHDIELPTGYNAYRLVLTQLVASTPLSLEALFAFNDVPTFKTGADDYGWGAFYVGPNSTIGSGVDASDARIGLIATIAPSSTGQNNHAELLILSTTTGEAAVACEAFHENASYGFVRTWSKGSTRGKTYGKATYIRLKGSTGTIAFKYNLYGIPNV